MTESEKERKKEKRKKERKKLLRIKIMERQNGVNKSHMTK